LSWKELEQSNYKIKNLASYLRSYFRLIEGDPFGRMLAKEEYKHLEMEFLKRKTIDGLFRKESANAVVKGIEAGRNVIISRVLETDVDWLFYWITMGLHMADFYIESIYLM
jgi:hypothetical protein